MPDTPDKQTPRRRRQLILDSIVLGIGGAAAAQFFLLLLRAANALLLYGIAGYHPPGIPAEGGQTQEIIGRFGLWLVPVVTTFGGLVVGIVSVWLAPEVEGHGTDTAVRAFHRAEGLLRPRVTPLKLLTAAVTIGSGGSAGREGPVALAAAGLGSWYGTATKAADRDRRLLLLIGMAAGLAAVFRSPVGTALFAIEVLYSDMEFEAEALLYTMLASIVAYAVNGFFAGWTPLFSVPTTLRLTNVLANGWFVVLGVAAGLTASVFPTVFYWTRDRFRDLPVPAYVKPALGGLGVGLLGIAVPQVLGGGYGWIQRAIDGRIALWTLLALAFAKIVGLSLSISSGGSGGVFAPSLFVGAMLGGFFAAAAHQPPAPFVIVGMAAVFAGAAHVPVATLMMVTEMTGGYQLLVPAALAVMLSYLVQTRVGTGMRYKSLYEAQVRTRADSPAHHAEHLAIALRLLRQRRVIDPAAVGQLDFLSLLRSGIPVELADERRLTIGVLRKDSRYVGMRLAADGARLPDRDANIITIIRGEHMMAPSPGTELKAGDRLILLTTRAELETLKRDVDPW